jgi:hypothetical protein
MTSALAQINQVLERADRIESRWAEALDKWDDGLAPDEVCDADRDARLMLSRDAIAVLRSLITELEAGKEVKLVPPPPELIFMVWDGGPDEEPFEDDDVILDHGSTYVVCPACWSTAGVVEVDRCERWNPAEIEIQSDAVYRMAPQGDGQGSGAVGTAPNPLAGLPLLLIAQDRDADFHTDHYACGACRMAVELPEWVEVEWS